MREPFIAGINPLLKTMAGQKVVRLDYEKQSGVPMSDRLELQFEDGTVLIIRPRLSIDPQRGVFGELSLRVANREAK